MSDACGMVSTPAKDDEPLWVAEERRQMEAHLERMHPIAAGRDTTRAGNPLVTEPCTPVPAASPLSDSLESWHAFLRRNPITNDLLSKLPEAEQEAAQSYWMAGYAQGRMER